MAFVKNVGGMDRRIRIILGLLFLSIGLFGEIGTVGRVISFALAGIGLFTGFSHYCPMNSMLGVNTAKPRK